MAGHGILILKWHLMTKTEYVKLTGAKARGLLATINKTIRNKGGEIITKGETVVLMGKSGRGGFNVNSVNGVGINRVDYSTVEILFYPELEETEVN